MDIAQVRRLVRQQRVVPHPTKYHAGRHGLSFIACVAALEHCHAVKRDARHADGWYALSSYSHGRILRVDFDVHEDEAGNLLLIVTAYHT